MSLVRTNGWISKHTELPMVCVIFTDDLPLSEVAGPPGDMKRNSKTMALQLKMFHIQGPDIEGYRQMPPVRTNGRYQSIQNFRACVVFADDLPVPELQDSPG